MPRRLAPATLALLLTACGNGEPLLPPDAVLPDGGRYRGELVDGRLQGQGRIDYSNGSYYAGNFRDGLFDGPGEWRGAGGEHYKGNFRQGLFDGMGELVYHDGTRYRGSFRQGRMHGEGHLQQEGMSYRGEFTRFDSMFGDWPEAEEQRGSRRGRRIDV